MGAPELLLITLNQLSNNYRPHCWFPRYNYRIKKIYPRKLIFALPYGLRLYIYILLIILIIYTSYHFSLLIIFLVCALKLWLVFIL